MAYQRECRTCKQAFETDNYRKIKCRKECRTITESNSARKAKQDEPMEFIGADGEGVDEMGYVEEWDEETGEIVILHKLVHKYIMLSVGDQTLHKNGDVLNFEDIVQFLWDQFQEHPTFAYVGFFLGYDFAQWLKSLPATKAWRLLHTKGIASRQHRNPEIPFPWPVRSNGWEFDILGAKRFKIRPDVPFEQREIKIVHHRDGTITEKRVHPHKWMYICDTGPFFQTSLMQAIDPSKWSTPIVTDAEYEILQRGKDNRDKAVFGAEMIEYNILENDVLSRLMQEIDRGLRTDGIRLARNKWFGPGQAAQAWLTNIGCPTGEEVRDAVPQMVRDAARESYYGGWFEIFAHGQIPGDCHAYDINSAYPHIIRQLPCLLHGMWTTGTGKLPIDVGHLVLVRAAVTGKDTYIGAMPHRRPDGTILRPHKTEGWYWRHELDAARRANLISRIKILEWIEYTPCACPPPLKSIEDLYEGRLEVGKNSPAGKAKKLIYNSAYGKMAQSIGRPKFSNPLYASLITAGCRTMILDAIATHPEKSAAVVMIATDSVTFLTPHPSLHLDDQVLGAWDHTVHVNLSLLMPGLYWDDSSRAAVREGLTPKVKSRGVPARDLVTLIDQFDALWANLQYRSFTVGIDHETGLDPDTGWPTQTITLRFAMVSAKLAAAQNRWHDCGRVSHDSTRTISADPRNKRAKFAYNDLDRPDAVLLRSYPYDAIEGEPRTTPYAKGFGENDWEQRDNAELLTPDGYALDGIRGVIPG